MRCARRIISLLALFIFLFVSVAPAPAASEYEDALAESMREALVKTGMQPKKAENVTQQYVFFGILMLNDVQKQLLGKHQEKLLAQAGKVGTALGGALGYASKIYGDKKMQETPAVMMLAARAGINPEAAAETFGTLAQSGYAFDTAIQTLHEAAETVRSAKFSDAGTELLRGLRKIATRKGSVQELQAEIITVAKAEKMRQKELIAKNEKERKKRGSDDGNDSSSSRRAVNAQPGGNAGARTSGSRGTPSSAAGDAGSGLASGPGENSAASSGASSGAASSGPGDASGESTSDSGSSSGSGEASGGGANSGEGSDGSSGDDSNSGEGSDGSSGGDSGSEGSDSK